MFIVCGGICFAHLNKRESCEDAVIWGASCTNCYSEPHRVCRFDSVLLGCTLDLLLEGEISVISMKLMHKPANVSIDGFLCRKKNSANFVTWNNIKCFEFSGVRFAVHIVVTILRIRHESCDGLWEILKWNVALSLKLSRAAMPASSSLSWILRENSVSLAFVVRL